MTSQTYQADDGHLVQEDPARRDGEQIIRTDPGSHPGGAAAPAGQASARSFDAGYPVIVPDHDDLAAEPESGDSHPGSLSLSLGAGASKAPASAAESASAGTSGSPASPWNDIQAMFVDEPRASIERAASLVDARAGDFIESLRNQQRSLQSAWHGDGAGTEELRVVLQHYRTFWNHLEDLAAQG